METIENTFIDTGPRGGADAPDNICLACPTCNFRKGIKTAQEFLQEAKV